MKLGKFIFRLTEEMHSLREEILSRGISMKKINDPRAVEPETWDLIMRFMRLAEDLHLRDIQAREKDSLIYINGADGSDPHDFIGRHAKLKRVFKNRVQVEIDGERLSLKIDHVGSEDYATPSAYDFLLEDCLREDIVLETVK
jgi:hypothetical protein